MKSGLYLIFTGQLDQIKQIKQVSQNNSKWK